jgi:uncharacterized protein YceK
MHRNFHIASLLIVAIAAVQVGCTTVSQRAITGYEAAVQKSIEAADDNAIRTWATLACATPYSAAIRNTQIVPALKALCLPAGLGSSPAALPDAIAPVTGVSIFVPAPATGSAK